MRVLLLGFGDIGHTHAQAWRNIEGVDVLTVDTDESKSPDICSTAEEALRWRGSDVDAVDICLPHNRHVDLALEAEALGLPYVVEKPLAPTLTDALEIAAANEASGLTAMVAENWLYAPAITWLFDTIPTLDLGSPKLFRGHAEFRPKGSPRDWYWDREVSGGGVIMSMGVHLFAVARRLLGGEPVDLVWARALSGDAVEDGVIVSYGFRDADAVFVVDRVSHRSPGIYSVSLMCERGLLECDVKAGLVRIHRNSEIEELQFPRSMGIPEELTHFSSAIVGDSHTCSPPSSEVGTVKMAEMAYVALKESGCSNRAARPLALPLADSLLESQ